MYTSLKRCGLVGASLLVCGLLRAGEGGWSVGGSTVVMTDSIFGIGKTFGVSADGAYSWKSEAAGLPLRATLGYVWVPASGYLGISGTDPSQYKIGLQDLQLGLDGFATLPGQQVRLFFGFTLNKWRVDADSHYFVPDSSPAGGQFQSGSVRGPVSGIKLGLRLGLERPFTDHLSGVLTFQATALGTSSEFMVPADPNWSATSGNVGVNPCWLQLGVRYHY